MRTHRFAFVFLIVFVSAVALFFSACPAVTETKPGSGIISVTIFQDGTPLIENKEIILDSSDIDRSEAYIFLEDPDIYDEGSIVWRIPGTDIIAEGAVFTLSAIQFKTPGFYYINVAVKVNGVPFSAVFPLNVLVPNEG